MAGTVVVAGAEVTVIVDGSAGVVVDGSAGTVTVVGSAGTVSVADVVTVTVDIGVEVTVPGTCTLNVAWKERLAVAEKLALTDASAGLAAGASVVTAVVGSVAVAVPVPGSVEPAVGWAGPVSVAGSVAATSGTETSSGAPDGVFVRVTLVRLRTVLSSKACMVSPPGSFGCTGGLDSVRTMSVVPIAVVTSAATTPARDICRRKRSADGPALCRPHHRGIRGRGSAFMSGSAPRPSLLSTVCIQLLLSLSRCACRGVPATADGMIRKIRDHTVGAGRKQARSRNMEFRRLCRTPNPGQCGVASPDRWSEASRNSIGYREEQGADTARPNSTARSGLELRRAPDFSRIV
ncbi:hypothetical protein ACPESR_16760 [Nocardia testacea]|uniref:hypothetical protein n=1 Tax=Nocardia testacea TaxID=248551 RepID=UPI003C2BE713